MFEFIFFCILMSLCLRFLNPILAVISIIGIPCLLESHGTNIFNFIVDTSMSLPTIIQLLLFFIWLCSVYLVSIINEEINCNSLDFKNWALFSLFLTFLSSPLVFMGLFPLGALIGCVIWFAWLLKGVDIFMNIVAANLINRERGN